MSSINDAKTPELKRVPVWDIPVRLFHWSLVTLVIILWITAEQESNWMEVHKWCGYILLTLLLFRILWGLVGSQQARFCDFIVGIHPIFDYLKHLFKPHSSEYLGHNPLGGLSVVALLLVLLIQGITGLFAFEDAYYTQGALVHWVTEDTSRAITKFHHFNFNILLALIVLHLSAISFYLIFKRDNLIHPMITGYKRVSEALAEKAAPFVSLWRALLCLAIACFIMALVIFVF